MSLIRFMSLELNISNKNTNVSITPWINIIEDNFLPIDYFKILSEMPLDPIRSEEVKVSHNYISNDLKTNLDNISQDLAISIHLSCFSKLYDYLKLLAPKKIPQNVPKVTCFKNKTSKPTFIISFCLDMNNMPIKPTTIDKKT